jgi:cell division protein FtsZ
MIQFDFVPKASNIIKVIGVGGGGGNAVTYMHSLGIEGVDFILCNTDAKALNASSVPTKLQLGPSLTQGLGAGANPNVGQQACEESTAELANLLKENTKMVFITAGMGGGTGTGAAPVIAKIAKELGILTVAIVTTPFSHEGIRRRKQAEEGIARMRECVDTILVISNDKMRHAFGNLAFTEAFSKADNVLATAARCITDVINSTGHVVVDFADVCTVMRDGGVAIMGSAHAIGENRAKEAVKAAIDSPLLNDAQIKGAKWVLVNINSSKGEYEQTVDEIDAIQTYIQQEAGMECDVVLGLGIDDNLGEAISVTIVATGFVPRETDKAYDSNKDSKVDESKEVVSLTNAPMPTVSNEVDELSPNEVGSTITNTVEPIQELPLVELAMPAVTSTPVVEPVALIEEKVVLQLAPEPQQIATQVNNEAVIDNANSEVANNIVLHASNVSEAVNNESAENKVSETLNTNAETPIVNELAPTAFTIEEPPVIIPSIMGMGLRFTRPIAHALPVQNTQVQPATNTATIEQTTSTSDTTGIVSTNPDEKIILELSTEITEVSMPTPAPAQEPESDLVIIDGITINRRRGGRFLTTEELREEVEFELRKKALYDRANSLRAMNFNHVDDESSEPAFKKQNRPLPVSENTNHSDMSNVEIDGNSEFSTKAAYLNQNEPD